MDSTPSRPADLSPLSDQELQRVAGTLLLTRNPRRDLSVFYLLVSEGCGVRNALDLTLDRLDLVRGAVQWSDDGPWKALHPQTREALEAYLVRERRGHTHQVFTTRLGHPMTMAHFARLFTALQRELDRKDLSWLSLRRDPGMPAHEATARRTALVSRLRGFIPEQDRGPKPSVQPAANPSDRR